MREITMRCKILLLIGIFILAACAKGVSVPSVKTLVEEQSSNTSKNKSDTDYIIGPGDILSIDVWEEQEMSKQVSVRLDGNISLPLVNDVEAVGLSLAQLREQLIEKYTIFKKEPEISVTLIESRSKRIYLLGKVTRRGEYLLQKDMTILQAISLAGGLAEWADADNIKLIRKIHGTEKTFRVDYDAIVSGEDMDQNVKLQPDDTIFVP